MPLVSTRRNSSAAGGRSIVASIRHLPTPALPGSGSAVGPHRWGALSAGRAPAFSDLDYRLVPAMEKLTDKLFTNKYVEDTGHPHIEIANQDVCRDKCTGKYCN